MDDESEPIKINKDMSMEREDKSMKDLRADKEEKKEAKTEEEDDDIFSFKIKKKAKINAEDEAEKAQDRLEDDRLDSNKINVPVEKLNINKVGFVFVYDSFLLIIFLWFLVPYISFYIARLCIALLTTPLGVPRDPKSHGARAWVPYGFTQHHIEWQQGAKGQKHFAQQKVGSAEELQLQSRGVTTQGEGAEEGADWWNQRHQRWHH